MNLLRYQRFLACLISLTGLCLGLLIYANLRGDNLILHAFLKNIGLFKGLQLPDTWFVDLRLPGWFKFALPDGLWMFSLGLIVRAVWNFTWHKLSIFWYSLALTTGLLQELLQKTSLVPGIFDWTDMLFILVGGLLPLVLFTRQKVNH